MTLDTKAIGVQFFGIGEEHEIHRKLWVSLRNHAPALLSAAAALVVAEKALESISSVFCGHQIYRAGCPACVARQAMAAIRER
jgi:hypothetical protein